MRLPRALLPAVLVGLFMGCTSGAPVRSLAWFKASPAFRGPVGADVVQIQWALIERPIGDRYLNDDLWALANEQVIPLERKDVLDDNGLRIAQLGGLVPPELQTLLNSERSNPEPHQRQLRAGQAATLPLGPVREMSHINPPTGMRLPTDPPGSREVTNAQFSVIVTPTLTSDGKTRLAFTPQIQHGESRRVIKPAEDGSGWTCREQELAERFNDLRWDVTLVPGEYVLVGCWFHRPETYGSECFLRVDEPRPVQRLLVIRTTRQPPDSNTESSTDTSEEAGTVARVMPIALQASTGPRR
jgi:hypothetical protein